MGKIKFPPPVHFFLGHYCPECHWWRYGRAVQFEESEDLHRVHMACQAPLKAMSANCTGKEMAKALEFKCQLPAEARPAA